MENDEEALNRFGWSLVSVCDDFQNVVDDVVGGVNDINQVWQGASRSTASSRRVLVNLEKVVAGLEAGSAHYSASDEAHLMMSSAPPSLEEKNRLASYESAVVRLGDARRYFMSRPKQKEELRRLEALGGRGAKFWREECERLAYDLGSGAYSENDKKQLAIVQRVGWLLAINCAAAGDCDSLSASYAQGRAKHKVPLALKKNRSWPYEPGEHPVLKQAIVVQKRLAQEQHLLEAILLAHDTPLLRLMSGAEHGIIRDKTRRPSRAIFHQKQTRQTMNSAKTAIEGAVRELLIRPALRALASSLRSAIEELGRAPGFGGNESRGLGASLEAARAAADLSVGFQKLGPLDCCAKSHLHDEESRKLAKVQRALATDAAEATADAFKSAIDAISRIGRRHNKPFPSQLILVYRILAPQIGTGFGRGLLFIVGDVLHQHQLLPPHAEFATALKLCSKALGCSVDEIDHRALSVDEKLIKPAQHLARCLFTELLRALSALVEAAGGTQELTTASTRRWGGGQETEEDQVARGAASRALERASRAFFALHTARALLNNLYHNNNPSPASILDHNQNDGPMASAIKRWLERVETVAHAHFIHAWKPCWAQLSGDPISPSDISLIATRFAVFNAHFERLARSHATWPELHPEIANVLRSKLRSKILSKWRTFFQTYAPIAAGVGQSANPNGSGGASPAEKLKPLPNIDKLLRWTPPLVDKAISSLFSGPSPEIYSSNAPASSSSFSSPRTVGISGIGRISAASSVATGEDDCQNRSSIGINDL
mmetsp:Transcript_17152/g.22269  ORF Transcript_17152/g.22269 Transcript_17152/m.22269 type:complete len:775 (+) Transcript_17152:65-2389(+)